MYWYFIDQSPFISRNVRFNRVNTHHASTLVDFLLWIGRYSLSINSYCYHLTLFEEIERRNITLLYKQSVLWISKLFSALIFIRCMSVLLDARELMLFHSRRIEFDCWARKLFKIRWRKPAKQVVYVSAYADQNQESECNLGIGPG